MSSNPLTMDYEGGDYTSWLALPAAGCWATAQAVFAGCVVT